MNEEWRDIPGYEGSYQVNEQGQIRSIDRYEIGRKGRERIRKGRLLAPQIKNGITSFALCREGKVEKKSAYTWVQIAFYGQTQNGIIYKPKNCQACNSSFQPTSPSEEYCENCQSVICENCGKQFKKHTPNRKEFFCSLKCRTEHRFKNIWVEVECPGCGKLMKKTPKAIQENRIFCSKTCYGKHSWTNDEVREKRIDGIKNTSYFKSETHLFNLRIANKKRKFTPECREKIRQARLRQKFPRRMTSIEKALYNEFVKHGLIFEMHKSMFNRWQPDFVFNEQRIIVQADGDYWHSFDSRKKSDAEFDRTAQADGWTVLRFTETKINNDLSACINIVLGLIQQASLALNPQIE